ncbi:hypothetical protein BDW02DRAFT_375731 [Decorospora gaudefroyi]|uniref:Uncharacterized protein n=1 Tax=Decorospora gaudefroyi TaxID=184978 RepID=A0A6A5K8B3_9PLEO|nr:hypothetical protein BDW02DRAFT_375731 [Decorospora gaudefroyi]
MCAQLTSGERLSRLSGDSCLEQTEQRRGRAAKGQRSASWALVLAWEVRVWERVRRGSDGRRAPGTPTVDVTGESDGQATATGRAEAASEGRMRRARGRPGPCDKIDCRVCGRESSAGGRRGSLSSANFSSLRWCSKKEADSPRYPVHSPHHRPRSGPKE